MDVVNIAAVVSGLDEEYPYYIIRGINKFARDHNINVSYFAAFGGVVDSRKFDIGEFSIYNLTDFSKFDGVILLANTFIDTKVAARIIEKVKASGIPTVIFESSDHEEFNDISIDNFTVMKKLVEHIIVEHKAKTINYISGPLGMKEGKDRYDAFVAAMTEHGLEIDERRIYYGSFRSFEGAQAIETFVNSGLPMADAVISANDSMALTALTSLEKLGYKVPEDVIVTGFDNTYYARNSFPSLTTVDRPLYHSGYKACDVLLNVINGIEQPKSTILDASPVFTESCGCPSRDHDDLKKYRKDSYRRTETNNSSIHLLNRLTAALAETETADEIFDVIAKTIPELECEKFSLCLVSDWEMGYKSSYLMDEYAVYPESMTAPLIWDNGERRCLESFSSNDMFPEPLETGGNISYFLPLHFGEKCLGYYIITNSEFPIYSLLCHTLTLSISNSIENISKLAQIKKTMDELNRLYITDPLCNIYNRNGFKEVADKLFNDCVEHHSPMMISFIDMDGLKFINDHYGHNEGDYALQRLSQVILDCCGENSICARFGGDEFVIFSVNITENTREEIDSRFETELKNINASSNKPYLISGSIGSVVMTPCEHDDLYSIIKLADEKMYKKKREKNVSRNQQDA